MNEQEIMMNVADMMMQLYAAESTALRVEKMQKIFDEKHISIYKDILDVFVYDAAGKIGKAAKDALASIEEDEALSKLLKGAEFLSAVAPVNVKDARRRIAERLIYDNRYTF
jgi:hypothetical protein